MGVSTKAVLFGHIDIREIADAIVAYGAKDVVVTGPGPYDPQHRVIRFLEKDGQNQRSMHVYLNSHTAMDNRELYTGEQTNLNFGADGDSVEIVRTIAEHFGGYIQESDARGGWELVDPVRKQPAEVIEANRVERAIEAATLAYLVSLQQSKVDIPAAGMEAVAEHITASLRRASQELYPENRVLGPDVNDFVPRL